MFDSVRNYLVRARRTDDPVGDLIADLLNDPELPPLFSNIREVRTYLRRRSACEEAMQAVPVFWRRYRRWLDQHPCG